MDVIPDIKILLIINKIQVFCLLSSMSSWHLPSLSLALILSLFVSLPACYSSPISCSIFHHLNSHHLSFFYSHSLSEYPSFSLLVFVSSGNFCNFIPCLCFVSSSGPSTICKLEIGIVRLSRPSLRSSILSSSSIHLVTASIT